MRRPLNSRNHRSSSSSSQSIRSQNEDPYFVLGLNRSVSESEVKKKYRELAKQYHPDLNNNDPRSVEKMSRISNSYDILMDPKKRKLYDQTYA